MKLRELGMPAIVGLDALDSAKYLYLRELSEPKDNSLRLVLQEAVANPSGLVRPHAELPELTKILTGASPIESTEDCRSFELTWNHYVAYLVTEECVGSCGGYNDETFSGKLFRVYTKSHFLDHLARDTGGHTGAILHYKLTCLNHLIDVAAYTPPEVRQVGPAILYSTARSEKISLQPTARQSESGCGAEASITQVWIGGTRRRR